LLTSDYAWSNPESNLLEEFPLAGMRVGLGSSTREVASLVQAPLARRAGSDAALAL